MGTEKDRPKYNVNLKNPYIFTLYIGVFLSQKFKKERKGKMTTRIESNLLQPDFKVERGFLVGRELKSGLKIKIPIAGIIKIYAGQTFSSVHVLIHN